MKFKAIDYMVWAKTHTRAAINLSLSSVGRPALSELKIDWSDLELSLPHNPYGYPPLTAAVADRFNVEEENVVLTQGASHALFLICAALLLPGDSVLIEKPAYQPLIAVPEAFNARVNRFERRYDQEYKIDPEQFSSALIPGTKLVLLTDIHNPSGIRLPRESIKLMAEKAQEIGAALLIDEIYLEFLSKHEERTAFSLADNIFVISSLTKVYGLGGLRCGWILTDPKSAERLKKINDYINVEGVHIGEQLAAIIFPQLDMLHSKNSSVISDNFGSIKRFIKKDPRLSWIEPAGGVVCFPRVTAEFSGDELAKHLRSNYDTGVVPGSYFEEKQHFRLGFGVVSEVLKQGLDNINNALNDLSKSQLKSF